MTHGSAPKSTAHKKTEQRFRELAMAYPEVNEDHPWGECAFKVKGKKVFLFLHAETEVLGMSMKLPHSRHAALMMPFAEPTGYGLGKAGWVSARFNVGDELPMDMLAAWLDESYRAVAPATLVKQLDARKSGGAAPDEKSAAKKKAPVKKKAATKSAAAKKKVTKKK